MYHALPTTNRKNYMKKQKWIKNQLEFLKPLALFAGTLYLAPILTALQQPNHVVSPHDFIPSSQVVTAIVLYMVNAAHDFLRKWAN